MAEHTEEYRHPTPGLYAVILIALMVGTCLTWAIAFVNVHIHIGNTDVNLNPAVALTIAVIKAVLVVLFFMHIYYSNKLTKLTVAAGFFWLLIMITMSMLDYLTRAFLPSF
jgi:cytochrome c oxidase subunit IV